MCGRYYVADDTSAQIENLLAGQLEGTVPSLKKGDVFPSQSALTLVGGSRHILALPRCWGFEIHGRLLINARSETVEERPLYRKAFEQGRCLLPAASFYEWTKDRRQMRFWDDDCPVLFLGGIWRPSGKGGEFVILTRPADSSVSPVHDRMPVIVPEKRAEEWVFETDFARALIRQLLDTESSGLVCQAVRSGSDERKNGNADNSGGHAYEQTSLFD